MPAPAKPVLLASFETSMVGRTAAQRHNAELAVRKLNGAVIQPGQQFSFNDRVGSWSRDQGYRRAPVSYNGTLIADWGGGVCQTSTTLYNAALLAGMDVTERNHHRFAPEYVDPGRDAAVAYGEIDLRFTNPFKYPVKIEGNIQGDRLELSLYGSDSLKVKPEIVTEMKSIQEPRIYRLPGDGGTHFIRNSGKAGCAVWTYRVTGDRKELLSTDEYPVMNKIEESQ
jgi:vancomycin resistance protein VanW